MAATVKTYIDFSGGYHTDTPSSFMPDTALLKAENCVWRNGLVMRNGYTLKVDFDGYTVCGFIRAGISGSMRDYIALKDENDAFSLAIGDGDDGYDMLSMPLIDARETRVRMVEFSGVIVIVGQSGYSRATVVKYEDSAHVASSIDAEDVRTREPYEWYAGSVAGGVFTDDSVDAQAGVWELASATGNGFYIASDLVFNRIEITSLTSVVDSIVVKYSKGTEWVTVTPTVMDLDGKITVEFALPFSGSEIAFTPCVNESALNGKYAVQVLLSYSGANPSGVISYIRHTEYFKQITRNECANDAAVYRSMLCLSFGNVVNFSPPDSITGWRADDLEIFVEGGNGITRLLNFRDSMLVFKPRSIYGFSGNSLNNPTVTRLTDLGTAEPDSVAQVDNGVMFVSPNGVAFFDGLIAAIVSKHIASELRGHLSGVCSTVDDESCYLVCTDKDGFYFQPNTVHQNSLGEYVMSAFKFTGFDFDGVARRDDDRTLVAWRGGIMYALLEGTSDADDPIPMDIVTKQLDFGAPGVPKHYFRFKPIGLAHGEISGEFLIQLNSGNGEAQSWVHPSDIGNYRFTITVPYDLDGIALGVRVATYSLQGASIQGFSMDVKGGTF